MRYKSSFKIALGCTAAVAIVLLLLCAAFYGFADYEASIYSPEAMIERVRQHTDRVLHADLNPSASSAIKVPYVETSGKWLSDILKKNNNHYSIKIMGIWGDYASPIPGGTGTTVATAHVIFPDGAVVEMQYYADTLDLCRLVTDGTF